MASVPVRPKGRGEVEGERPEPVICIDRSWFWYASVAQSVDPYPTLQKLTGDALEAKSLHLHSQPTGTGVPSSSNEEKHRLKVSNLFGNALVGMQSQRPILLPGARLLYPVPLLKALMSDADDEVALRSHCNPFTDETI